MTDIIVLMGTLFIANGMSNHRHLFLLNLICCLLKNQLNKFKHKKYIFDFELVFILYMYDY